MTNVEIGWLAGLIEGEGCIGLFKNGKHTQQKIALVQIAMTDFDIVERLYQVTAVGNLTAPTPRLGYKPQLRWKVSKQRDVLQILYTVWPLLGERKQRSATESIRCILAAPGRGRSHQ